MQSDIRPEVIEVQGALILYDAAQGGKVHARVFDPGYWREQCAIGSAAGGRGSAWRIQDSERDWYLRLYRRGGLPGRFIHDRYLFTGLNSTRPWREWNLLADLFAQGLPVPRPVAAAVWRGPIGYRGGIITEAVTGVTLASRLKEGVVGEPEWRAAGQAIRRLHDARVWHADLNAHNVLIDVSRDPPRAALVDFDRSRVRASRDGWRAANLQRLLRSLRKVSETSEQRDAAERGFLQIKDSYETAAPASANRTGP